MTSEGIKILTKILSNQVLDFSNPGFIILRFGGVGGAYDRSIALSEDLLCLIEEYSIKEYGLEGQKILYQVGKDFAFNFGECSNFPTIKTASEDDIKYLAFNFLDIISAVWCEKLEIKDFDINRKTAEFKFKDFVVFRKNGLGYSILDGVTAGFFDFFIADSLLESSRKILNKSEIIINVSIENNKFRTDVKNYPLRLSENSVFNAIKSIRKPSFNDFINTGLISYKNNMFLVNGKVFFQCHINFLYILEAEFKSKNLGGILFKAGYDFSISFFTDVFKNIKKEDRLSFSSDFFSALGFGDVNFFNDHVICTSFPWSSLYKEVDFMIFKGIFSGVLSLIYGNIILNNHKISINNGLDVIFE
jgi:hypothetical protein